MPAPDPRNVAAPARERSGRKLLIVNADDLGRTRGINEGIFEAHRRGLVTSATLMVNYEPARAAVEALRDLPGLGVGLHVALTGGAPVLPADRVSSLVDERGVFPAKPEGLGRAKAREIAAEARAQLARFRELTGREPTHFDSHHHSHRIPAVCDALIELGRACNRPVRRANAAVEQKLGEAGLATTDAFVERFFGEEATLPILLEILRGLEVGVTELMCHPARVDDDLRRGSSYVDDRERELAVLTDERARAAIEELGIELVTFEALPGAAGSTPGDR